MATDAHWIIIPAAGIGSRARTNVAKQYILTQGKTILEHSLARFTSQHWVKGIMVALHPDDRTFAALSIAEHPLIHSVIGGDTRAESVFNALNAIQRKASPSDWVWVHDAARPCLHPQDLYRLFEKLKSVENGVILAQPSQDTLKKVDNYQIVETLDRKAIWSALTPQVFRLPVLFNAMQAAQQQGLTLTDESSFVERMGKKVDILEATHANPKFTYSSDLEYITHLLAYMQRLQAQEVNIA